MGIEGTVGQRLPDPALPLPTQQELDDRSSSGDTEGRARNHGLDADLVDPRETWSLSGQGCTRCKALEAVAGGVVVDDSRKMRLTVVADEATRKAVLADLATHPALKDVRGAVLVTAYPPDHWVVKELGLAPGLTLQPAGTVSPVLWRMRTYAGPAALAEAIKKADPNYNPDLDPDPTTKPALDALVAKCEEIPAWAYAVAAVVVLMLRKPQEQPK